MTMHFCFFMLTNMKSAFGFNFVYQFSCFVYYFWPVMCYRDVLTKCHDEAVKGQWLVFLRCCFVWMMILTGKK